MRRIILILALAAILVVPAMATSESGNLTSTPLGSSVGSVSGGTSWSYSDSNAPLAIRFQNIENYDEISLYQAFVPNDDWNYGTGEIVARIDDPDEGTEVGSGEITIFHNGADTTIHIQFDSWDIGAASGEHIVYLDDFDPTTGAVSTKYNPTYSDHYLMMATSAGSATTSNFHALAGEYDPTAYYHAYFSASYVFTDSGDHASLVVDRTNTQYPKPSWVIIKNSSGTTLLSEYKASGSSSHFFLTDPTTSLDIGFGAVGGNKTKTFYLSESPGETESLAVNLWEKYSNAILINQAITVTPADGGAGETKTSTYGQTLYFDVIPGESYWFNASRSGYEDYNETYLIPAPPGSYSVYMTKTLTPYANKSYAHFSVVDMTNGGLVPNAAITLSDGQSKLTNSAGYTFFSVNDSEAYSYTVKHQNGYYIPASGAFNISSDTKILVALQRTTGPTPTWTLPSWTPVTVPTTSGGGGAVVPTLSAQLRQQNVQQGMDVWYTNLPFISQFLFLLFIIGGLGLMAGGGRRN